MHFWTQNTPKRAPNKEGVALLMALKLHSYDTSDIEAMAKAAGIERDGFFRTTFERYQTQLYILRELEAQIQEAGMLVTKEYVKGRENIYTNPAVADFNRTTDSANKTVSTLIKIIKSFGNAEKEERDPLLEALNGTDE
jgi:hypothetical protein